MSFISNITLGQFIPAKSLIHELDPRSKIAITILLMAQLFIIDSFSAMALWGLFLLIALSLSNVPIKAVLRSLKPVFFFIIFTLFIHLFNTKGREILAIGPFSITEEGCIRAVIMSLRLIYLVLYASLLTLTTSPSKLSDGLESLMSPFKRIGFPAHEIALMITIALRFIPTLFEETERIIKSQLSRGVNFTEGGLIKRSKKYIPVLIPMFALVFMKADILATAMESRSYRGGVGKTRMYPLKFGRKEGIVILFFIIYSLFVLLVERNFIS